MRVRIDIPPAEMTPSGTGAESYSIHDHPRLRNRKIIRLRDEEDNEINIVIDPLTLRLLGQSAVAATS